MVFNANMIQSRKPESVNASGITNIRSTNADVDSSSSSTIPTAYKTGHHQRLNQVSSKGKKRLPPKTKWAPVKS